ncbi:MAG: alpha/beta hydrolase family protein [Pseudomonadota bacterium]
MTLNRRDLMTASAAGLALAGCATAGARAPAATPKTFMLIHGTWHGGWVWRDVRNILEDRGHRVFTPTLTGCGEREHLSSPEVGLDTHIQDLVNVIDYEELKDLFILAHSFSGVAMTGAVDRRRDRIGHVCFFDALVPRPGRMSGVMRDEDGSISQYFLDRQDGFIDGYKMDFFADYPVKMLLPEEHPKAEWVRSKLSTHPAKSWTDELVLENGGWDGLPRSFVHCVGQDFGMTSDRMIGPARGEGWDFVELDAPRNAMVTHPERVADLLERLAA